MPPLVHVGLNRSPLSVVTPRNLYSLTESTFFPFAVNSGSHSVSFLELARTIVLVFPSLICIFHLSAHLRTLLISSCINVRLLPLIFPSFIQVAVSSAKRLATVSGLRSTSMSLMKIRNRSGDMDDPCGRPSLSVKGAVLVPLTSTQVFRPLRKNLTYRMNLGG